MPRYLVQCVDPNSFSEHVVPVDAATEEEAKQRYIDAGMIVGSAQRVDNPDRSSVPPKQEHDDKNWRSHIREENLPRRKRRWPKVLAFAAVAAILIAFAIPRTRYLLLPIDVDISGSVFVRLKNGSSELLLGEKVSVFPARAPLSDVQKSVKYLDAWLSTFRPSSSEYQEWAKMLREMLSESKSSGYVDVAVLSRAMELVTTLQTYDDLAKSEDRNITTESARAIVQSVFGGLGAQEEIDALAIGSVFSDASGKFVLKCRPGLYVLRAKHTRQGFAGSQSIQWIELVDTRDGSVTIDLHSENGIVR